VTKLTRLLVGSLVVLVAVAWWWGRYKDAQLAIWRRRAEDALAVSVFERARADSLQLVEASQVRVVIRLRTRVDTLRLAAESLATHGDTAVALQVALEAVGQCRLAFVAADSALATCQQRAGIERARADSLAAVLRQGLTVLRPRRYGCTIGLGATAGLGRWGALGASVTCGRHL
jgi:hypothetical protein